MNAIILMTRAPIEGQTKTRLRGFLTDKQCAGLHTCFLLDLFEIFDSLKDIYDIYVYYTPENSLDLFKEFMPKYTNLLPQSGSDLGKRMDFAFKKLFSLNYSKVILIGSDIPSIHSTDISNAFKALNDSDIVIGPTYDGGYYLLGIKKENSELFSTDVSFSNSSVLDNTVSILNSQNLKFSFAKKHLDIDTKDDVISFFNMYNGDNRLGSFFPKNTFEFIHKILGGTGNGNSRQTNSTN